MAPSRVLVTGASSSPGYKVLLELASRGYKVIGVYNKHKPPRVDAGEVELVRLDLTEFNSASKLISRVKPDAIFHIAALGNVDLCEENRELAWLTNVEVTRFLAKTARRNSIPIVYLSTDYVFDGEKGLYTENETPKPINYYGLTKLLGEEAILSGVDEYIIIRTSSIYGLGAGRVNFGRFLLEALSKGEPVRALVDQWLSPTLNTLLAKAIVDLFELQAWGLYHVAGERVSRYEFALKLAERFGFDKSLVKPARMSEFKWKAPRPRDSSLDSSRARGILNIDFYSLDKSLDLLYREWRGYSNA